MRVPGQSEQERRARLGKEIARSREKREWSQDDLADRAGLGRRTITQVETGNRVWATTLRAIERAFDWPDSYSDELARGAPNPDFAAIPLGRLLPIEMSDVGQGTDAEWNEMVKTFLEGIKSVRKYLGDDFAELMTSRMIEAADKRGDTEVANTLRRII
jgi:transcriptional regulator with XRE-family HTH domain